MVTRHMPWEAAVSYTHLDVYKRQGESKEKLKKCLTEEEYNSLLDGENGIETSSLFIEWIRNILFS